MPRTFTVEKTVFTFDELSDSAKEAARSKFNQWSWEDGSMQESMQAIADGILEEHGFGPARGLSYSLYSQGGDPTFETEGKWTDPETEVEYDVTVTQNHRGGGSYYLTVWASEVDSDEPEVGSSDEVRSRLTDFFRNDVAGKIMKAFYAEDEYQSSEAVVKENCEANGYEFDENGKLA